MRDFVEHGYQPTQHVYVGGATGGDDGIGITSSVYPFAWGVRNQRLDENIQRPHHLPRYSSDNGTAGHSLSEIKNEIDQAVSGGNGLVLYGHHIIDGADGSGGDFETSTGRINEVISYAQNAGMEWVSPSELLTKTFLPQRWGGTHAPHITQSTDGSTRIKMSDVAQRIYVTDDDGDNKLYWRYDGTYLGDKLDFGGNRSTGVRSTDGPPSDTSTVASWEEVEGDDGSTYYRPLYQ